MNTQVSDLTVAAAVDRYVGDEMYVPVSAIANVEAWPNFLNVHGMANWGVAGTINYNAIATVDTQGAIFVFSPPTNQFHGVYAKAIASINAYKDMDVLLKPKSTRTIKGRIVERAKGKFETE